MWINDLIHPFKWETYEDGNYIDFRVSLLKFPFLTIVLGEDSFVFIILGFGFSLDW